MKKVNLISPGQALAIALFEAAESCRTVRDGFAAAQAGARTPQSKHRLRRLANSVKELDRQLANASRMLDRAVPGLKRVDLRDSAQGRQANLAAGAAIDRELAAANALAEEASGDTPAAALAAKLLLERQDGTHRRIDRLAAKRGAAVRAKARRAHTQIEIVVHEAEKHQAEQTRRKNGVAN